MIKTPCVGVCSTGIGDSVCRGCKRFAHEIIDWNSYSDFEKQAVLQRLDDLLAQVVRDRLRVKNSQKLKDQLILHKITFNNNANEHCLAYEAIRRFGSQLPNFESIGCAVLPAWRNLATVELKQIIEEDFYELSCAHFERYFTGVS